MTIEDIMLSGSIDSIKEGKVIKSFSVNDKLKEFRPREIDTMREMIAEIGKLYSSGKKPTLNQVNKICEKHKKVVDEDIHDFLGQLRNDRNLFKVIKRKEKGNKIIVEYQKVNEKDRARLIREISLKLIKKLSPEQILAMIEEGVRQNNDSTILRKINKDLDKKKPKVEARRGCYKIMVNGRDVLVIK